MMRYRAKEMYIKSFKGKVPENINQVIIIQYNDENPDVWFPSPLTNFIHHKYNNSSINTKIKVARIVTAFLNYLIEQVTLGEDKAFKCLKSEGLFALNHYHLAKYINYISQKEKGNITYSTVKDKENYLIKFYSFLYSRGITSDKAKIKKKLVPSNDSKKKGMMVEISPFEDTDDFTIEYPDKNYKGKPVLKDMDEDVWNRFIEYAEEFYPNIALGVAFQCMGGLRMGEVINLTIDSLDVCKSQQHIKVQIQDRQEELFRDRKINERKSQNKKTRFDQPIFNFNGDLFDMLDRHLTRLAKNNNVKNTNALFINSKGQAMTGESYYKHFSNLKRDFMKYLEDEGYSELHSKLEKYKWGTHIGRHIFTNYLIKIGAVSGADGEPVAKYLMALRGDTSEKSSSVYIDTKAVIEIVVDKIDLLSKVAVSLENKKRGVAIGDR